MIVGEGNIVGGHLVGRVLPGTAARLLFGERGGGLAPFVLVVAHLEEALQLRHVTVVLAVGLRVPLAAAEEATAPLGLEVGGTGRARGVGPDERGGVLGGAALDVAAVEDEPLIELGEVLRLGNAEAARVGVVGLPDRGDGAGGRKLHAWGLRGALLLGARIGAGAQEELGPVLGTVLGVGVGLRDVGGLGQLFGG